MKVYVVFGNKARCDGDNIYGVFSSRQNAEDCVWIDSLKSVDFKACHSIEEFELDERKDIEIIISNEKNKRFRKI